MVDRPERVRHILALAPNWLGDAAMCTPALRALKRRFPEARLTVAGRDSVCALLEGLPWIDALAETPHRPGLLALTRLGWRFRPHARGLCVVFRHSFRAALLAGLTGARRRIGQRRDNRHWLLTDTVEPRREAGRVTPAYTAFEYLGLVAALGCEDDGRGLELHADEQELAAVRACFGGGGPVVAMAPGAAFGPSKQWPAARFAAVADLLHARAGARITLLTGPGEEALRTEIAEQTRAPLLDARTDGPGVRRMKAVLAASDLLVCNDTGPRHVAIAFGRPVVCVMGPTSPAYTASPWERGEVIRVDVDCGPCQQPVCATDHRCMTGIPPERVAEAALRWLPPQAGDL